MWCIIPFYLLSTLAATAFVEGSPLLPFKAPISLVARDNWEHSVLPKESVSLLYAKAGSQHASSSLTFSAHQDVPILLLEDIDFLVQTVTCHYSSEPGSSWVEIGFTSDDAYDATLAAWSSLSRFMLVTSHRSCNPLDQRGAWSVTGVSGKDSSGSIVLQAEEIRLHDIGPAFHLSHQAGTVATALGPPGVEQLKRRDIDTIFPIDEKIPFDSRQQLIPVPASSNISQLNNDDIPSPDGLQVFCNNCVSVADFNVGIEIDVNVVPPELTKGWINLTVSNFQQDFNLEISFDEKSSNSNDYDVFALPIPGLGLSIDIIDVGLFWGAAIRTDLEVEGELNFTVGASATIPTNSAAILNLTDLGSSSVTGWDKASFDVHPFRLNSGEFGIGGGLSFSPFVEATITFLGLGPVARLYVDAPSVHAQAEVAVNVSRTCQPLTDDDYEYFDLALSFGAGLNVSMDSTLGGDPFSDSNYTLYSTGLDFGDLPKLSDPSCMVVVDDQHTSTLAGSVAAATGTLTAAASAIPSFNVAAIQSYYSVHSSLPPNVNYGQMLQATTVPDDIKGAVQKAGAFGQYAALSFVSVTFSVLFGGAAVILF